MFIFHISIIVLLLCSLIAEPQILSDEMEMDEKEEQGELRESDEESDEEPAEAVRVDQLGGMPDVGASERRRRILLERARERERQRDLEAEQQARSAAKLEAEVVEELEAELDALEEESEEEEEEEDERGPRLKPVFVRKYAHTGEICWHRSKFELFLTD